MTKACLLIAERYEPTADFLLAELRRRGVPCVRWNLDQFPLGSSLTYRLCYGRLGAEIVSDGRRVSLDSVGSVWCRGLRATGFADSMIGADRRFAELEAQRALDALATTLNVRWINHPYRLARANSKPAQLAVALQVGLDIPPTVVTNDPAEVRRFVRQLTGDAIYKAHSQSINLEEGKALFTGLLTVKEMAKLDLIQVTPGIFQEFVAKAYEVRATVVGERIFSGRIDSQAHFESRIDWRHRPYDIEESPIELPADLQAKIHAMMRELGLVYGAFDFIVTPEGRHVFLEVNPSGQYLWVEAATKLPITAALVDALTEAI